jgi:hypothetical protein
MASSSKITEKQNGDFRWTYQISLHILTSNLSLSLERERLQSEYANLYHIAHLTVTHNIFSKQGGTLRPSTANE